MDHLTLQDDDGDELSLGRREANDRDAVLIKTPSRGVNVGEHNARALVDWLTEQFGLTRELTAQAVDAGLEISVETETGKTRTVRWYGPDVPGELVRLSEVALRVYDRGADATPDQDATLMLGHINMMVEELGLHGVHAGTFTPVERVRVLTQAFKDLRREAAAARQTPPAELAILRQLCVMLGLERAADIPARVEKLTAEINGVAAALTAASHLAIGPDGIDLVELVRAMERRHAAGIDKLKLAKYDEVRQARAAVQAQLDRMRDALLDVLNGGALNTHQTDLVKAALDVPTV